MPDVAYTSALEFLCGRINYERQLAVPYREAHYKLDRMRELLARLGRPDAGQKIVHVAGTKGKGSTATMIAAVLSAAGYRTGLFSSPHLERVEERIAIDGAPCSPEDLVRLVERVRPVVEQLDDEAAGGNSELGRPTYFEVTTAMALVHFAACAADAVVLEVGLGGRLDSTNVCQTVLSIITSISFDHTEQLGNTLAAIATEKAGIIKPGVPVISGVTAAEPRDAIRRVATERSARLVELDRDFSFVYRPPRPENTARPSIDFYIHAATRLEDVQLGMLGRHQAANAALALTAVHELRQQRWRIGEQAIRAGLATARCAARIEVVHRRPTVIVDAAHNVAAAEALAEALTECFAARKRVLVFAATRQKDYVGMLRLLLPLFDEVILTQYVLSPRTVDPTSLAAAAASLGRSDVRMVDDPVAAWQLARSLADEESLLCVTGSFFIAAELRRVLIGEFAEKTNSTASPRVLRALCG